MNKWQPIETAPKDGTEILTYRKADLMAVAAWFQYYPKWLGGWTVTDGANLVDVTHWMPLPDPPVKEDETK